MSANVSPSIVSPGHCSAPPPIRPGHVYDRFNELLAGADFGRFVEDLCRSHHGHEVGRPSLPPGTHFRLLFVSYFVGPPLPVPRRLAVCRRLLAPGAPR